MSVPQALLATGTTYEAGRSMSVMSSYRDGPPWVKAFQGVLLGYSSVGRPPYPLRTASAGLIAPNRNVFYFYVFYFNVFYFYVIFYICNVRQPHGPARGCGVSTATTASPRPLGCVEGRRFFQ